ncbi:hypothetical protein MKW92_047893 [Papaver armeniacum]|nr:hypothetical protein MKW92_047893 [Papaver armeniacum]
MKPHAVFIPVPAQGHVTPTMTLAKLFHSKGFHITFVNTEFNHQRLINSRGPDSTIPDGLPLPDDLNATQPLPDLLKLNNNSKSSLLSPSSEDILPPVTCIVSDGMMSFGLKVGVELGIPVALFWTASACGLICYLHFTQLIERGLVPLKDESDLTNGYLDTKIDWIPGMKEIRLRNLPSFVRTMDTRDMYVDYFITELAGMNEATALIINTFDALEKDVLDALKSDQLSLPPLYTIGPVHQLLHHDATTGTMKNHPSAKTTSIGINLWKEETDCLKWLDSREPNSVVYVNFGSITTVTTQQLIEFAGLANSKHSFLWIVRSDIVKGDTATLPPEFAEETKERGLLASWRILTHSGWNSTIESICGGVPIICYPFFAEQHTNCRYSCVDWGIGMQIEHNVTKAEVEKSVKELLEGEKGKKMKHRAMEWKQKPQMPFHPVAPPLSI